MTLEEACEVVIKLGGVEYPDPLEPTGRRGGPNLQNFPYSEKEVPRINRQDFFTECGRSTSSAETEDK